MSGAQTDTMRQGKPAKSGKDCPKLVVCGGDYLFPVRRARSRGNPHFAIQVQAETTASRQWLQVHAATGLRILASPPGNPWEGFSSALYYGRVFKAVSIPRGSKCQVLVGRRPEIG